MNILLKTRANDEMNDVIRSHVENDIARHRRWYIFEGILFLLLAALVALLPELTALTFEIVLGCLLAAGGAFRILQSFRVRHGRWWRILTGAAYAVVGAMMLIWPVSGLSALIWAIGLLLVIEGFFETVVAIAIKPLRSWGLLLAAGIASLVLGVLVLAAFPLAGILYIALALAASMALYGSSLLALAWRAGVP